MLESQLIAQARNGDHAAYAELVNRYKDAVYRVTHRILRNVADAEDAAQEAFVRAYVALDDYSDRFAFYTWLASIAAHVCFKALRARDWHVVPYDPNGLLASRTFLEDGPELALLLRERDDIIRQAVLGLPDKYRQVLILRHWHELSYEEISAVTRLSLGAVKTRLHRARQILAGSLTTRRPEFETK